MKEDLKIAFSDLKEKYPLPIGSFQIDKIETYLRKLEMPIELKIEPEKFTNWELGVGLKLGENALYKEAAQIHELSLSIFIEYTVPVSNANEAKALIQTDYIFNYNIKHLEEYLTKNEISEIGLLSMANIVATAFSTCRGLFFRDASYYGFKNGYLPIVDAFELIKNQISKL